MNDENGKCFCLGMAIGCLALAALLTAAGIGLYFWLNPQERGEQVEKVEKVWGGVKENVDRKLEQAKPAAEPR